MTPALVCVLAGMLGALLSPLFSGFENKAIDFFQRARYQLQGPLEIPEAVIIAIDERSVDPAASTFSDVWGKGGWLNRDNWIFQLQFHKDFFKPRVLAIDILLFESLYRELEQVAENIAYKKFSLRTATIPKRELYRAEAIGNESMAQTFYDMADTRLAGGNAPSIVLANYFPENYQTQLRIRERMKMDELLEYGASFFLDSRVVVGGDELLTYQGLQLPAEVLLWPDIELGSINVPRGTGGIVRRVPTAFRLLLEGEQELYVPSFALASFLSYFGVRPQDCHPLGQGIPGLLIQPGKQMIFETKDKRFTVPIDHLGRIVLNSRIRYKDISKFSFYRLNELGLVILDPNFKETLGDEERDLSSNEASLRERAKEAISGIEGKIAFIAQTFTGSGDIGNFPLENDIPNVMAHVIAMDNMMNERALVPPLRGQKFIVPFLVSFLAWLLWQHSEKQKSISAPLVVLLPVVPGAIFLIFFFLNFIVEPIVPTLVALGLVTTQSAYAYMVEAARRHELRKMFSAAVSSRVLEMMEQNPGEISLKGQRLDATIFFSDLAGFTSISEKLSPQALSQLLNRYLTPMSEIIINQDGYVDKYEGDAIMAVWGVPTPDEKHAEKACHAALTQLESLRVLSKQVKEEMDVELKVRIGINSGEVSAGNMGSEKKFQYTVMGDAVNLASRLEPINKDYGSTIIIGEVTHQYLPKDQFVTRLLDKIVVKGKTRAVYIYELVGFAGTDYGDWIPQYENSLKYLWQQNWDLAESSFNQVLSLKPEDPATQQMLARIQIYRAVPPSGDWDGAFIRDRKD